MDNDVPNNIEVGERIRNLREDLKMNRETFSEIINISEVFLGQIERGELSLSIKTLCRIVSFTCSSTDYILFGKNEENNTLQKITKILNRSSKNMQEYVYKIIIATSSFLKTYDDNKKE